MKAPVDACVVFILLAMQAGCAGLFQSTMKPPPPAVPTAADSCKDFEKDITEIWNVQVKASLEAYFTKSGFDARTEVVHSIQTKMDALTKDWVMLSERLCRDTTRGLLSKELYQRSSACLDTALLTQRSFISSLGSARPDAEGIGEFLQGMGQEIERCRKEALESTKRSETEARRISVQSARLKLLARSVDESIPTSVKLVEWRAYRDNLPEAEHSITSEAAKRIAELERRQRSEARRALDAEFERVSEQDRSPSLSASQRLESWRELLGRLDSQIDKKRVTIAREKIRKLEPAAEAEHRAESARQKEQARLQELGRTTGCIGNCMHGALDAITPFSKRLSGIFNIYDLNQAIGKMSAVQHDYGRCALACKTAGFPLASILDQINVTNFNVLYYLWLGIRAKANNDASGACGHARTMVQQIGRIDQLAREAAAAAADGTFGRTWLDEMNASTQLMRSNARTQIQSKFNFCKLNY